MDAQNLLKTVTIITVFGLVFSIWCICVFLWLWQYLSHSKALQKRLGIAENESSESRTLRLWRDAQEKVHGSTSGRRITIREKLERLRNDAGWNAPIETIILSVISITICAFVVIYLLGGGALLGIGVCVIIVVAFWEYLQRCISKQAALFERQLVDALNVAARALRAGHPLGGAFQLVADEIGRPLGDVFFNICREQTLGLDLKDSMRKVAQTTRNQEIKFFATAVAIQLKSGGNLADLMDSLASVIRQRMRLNQHIRVVTAQTQMSKKILIVLPFVLFFLINYIAPTYMDPLYNTAIGKIMLSAAACSVLLGAWIMKRLSILRY